MNGVREILETPQAAADACARHIIGAIQAVLRNREFATLAVSGGSTPKLLFDSLAVSGLAWERVHLFWADERCVPPDDPDSNYRLAKDHLISRVLIPEQNIHRIRGELEPSEAARLYADELRSVFGAAPPGVAPSFDVIQLGMGPDAHTASLFPGQPLIEDREKLVAAVQAPKPPAARVTLLPVVLLAARQTVFLVAGSDKAAALRSVFRDPYDPKRRPAQMIAQNANDVTWFLDRAAAAELA